jgi:hypothetical protein
LKAQQETHDLPRNQAVRVDLSAEQLTGLVQPDVASQQFATTRGPVPTDAELERAIVGAVSAGAFDVAKTLAAQLEEHRRERAGNVIALDVRRRGGR